MPMALPPRHAPALVGACLVLCTLALFQTAVAQVSTRVSSVSPTEAIAGEPFVLSVTLARSEGIERAVLVYRPFGESEYRQAEMDLRGSTARVVVPASAVQTPSLEYYIV